jgi:ATP-dependent RNA helicase DeaD
MQEERNSSSTTFDEFGLNQNIVKALARNGYDKPTELQREMIRPILEGHDVLVRARRGQGKTLGYLLPILHQIDLKGQVQAIVVSPTRELAMQISTECCKLLGEDGLQSIALHPGADVHQQANLLGDKVQIVTGTPGRLLDMLERQALPIKPIRFVVFDELDRLLNSGHLEPMRRLMHDLAHGRQLIWVTAGVDEEIQMLADKYLVEPKRIAYEQPERKLRAPLHELVLGPQRQQLDLLAERVKAVQPAASIVITSRRDDVRKVYDGLRRANLTVMSMDEEAARLAQRGGRSGGHGQPPAKPQRQESVVWVAAEMVTRAIDLPHVGILAHMGPPLDMEAYADYVCRLVRLGANLKRVVTLVEPAQRKRMEEMFAAGGITPEVHQIEVVAEEPEEESPAVASPEPRPESGRDREPRREDRGGRDRGNRDRRGGRDRGGRSDRGDRGPRTQERGPREGAQERGQPADGSYRSPAERAAAAGTGDATAAPVELKSLILNRLAQAKAAGYVTDTKSRDYPVIPLRYVLTVTAKPGKNGLPSTPPRKTLGSKFRTARRGSRKGPEE